MRAWRSILLAACTVLGQVVLAQPANNNYAGAIDVTGFINGCSPNAAYTTVGATADKVAGANWNNSGPRYNVWFKFTAPASGRINVVVDIGGAKGTQTRSQVALWQAGGTTEIASKCYAYNGEDLTIGSLGLTPGTTYYISVDTYNNGSRGTFTLCLQDQVDYDYYEGAIDVTSYINGCSPNAAYDTRGGTPDRNAGSNWITGTPRFNRWFKFTAPATGRIEVTVDIGGVKGNQQNTMAAIWQADGTTQVNSRTYVTNTEDVIIGAAGLTPGSTYYISVDSYSAGSYGTFTLCLQDQVDYDFYEGAIDVTAFINGCSPNAAYDTRGGTPDRNAGSNWYNGTPHYNRWFKFTAPATGRINVTVDVGGPKGGQIYSQVAIWQADGTTQISSKSYAYSTEDVVVGALGLTPGNIYYISVDSYNASTFGTFTLCLQDQVDYDYYEGAIDVTAFINGCSPDAAYDTRGGSPDRNAGSNWVNGTPRYNRWFKFTAPATGRINVTVDVGGPQGGQSYSQVAIWQADGTTQISSKSYAYSTEDVVIGALGLTPGNIYYISVDSYNTSTFGTFTLCLQDQVDYDYYEGAIDVTAFINGCSPDAAYDTRGGSPDRNAGSTWVNGTPHYNRWFKFTAPATGKASVTVDVNGAKGSQWQSQVAIWQNDGLTQVASKNFMYGTEDVIADAPSLTPGATYYISVDSYNTSTWGTFTLCLQDHLSYDYYEGAIDVTGLINGCSPDAAYDTRGGSPDGNAGSNWNIATPHYNRWFKFTAPHADQLRITVDVGGAKGSQSYSQLALWQSDGTTEIWSARYVNPTDDVVLRVPGLTPDSVYYISVDSYNTTTYGSFTLCLDAVDRPAVLAINEVLYAESGAATAAANDEFIEIYNPGADPVNLTGMRLLDGNILKNSTDGANSITGSSTPFNFVCSGGQVCSGPTVLQPGKFAVVWVGTQTPSRNATHASYQAWLGQAPKLNNAGDDVWLYSADSILIDHMAYGTGGEVNLPTLPSLWDDTYQASLAGVSSGQSISLTPSGADNNASGCWEASTSGGASGRCLGALPTVDLMAGPDVASPGIDNNAVDSDGDGVPDSFDLDSDNDGIPDKTECPGLIFKGDFEYLTGLVNGNNIGVSILPWILGPGQTANVVQVDGSGGYNYGQHGPFEDADPLTGSGVLQHYLDIASGSNSLYQTFTLTTTTTITYSGAFSTRENTSGNGSISIRSGTGLGGTLLDGTGLQLVNAFGNSQNTPWQRYTRTITLPAGTYSYVVYMDDYLNFDEAQVHGPCVDTDGDGVPDYLDLDSDNDGIYDLVEAGHGQADADHDGVIDGALAGSGANGLFDGVETGPDSNVLNYTIKDSDGDGVIDAMEIDSDNDGCHDVIEAGFSDSDGDGIPGHAPVTVDGNGVVTSLTP